jgi:hypothetical protein
MPEKTLQRDAPQELTPKQWIDRETAVHQMSMQRFLMKFICCILGGCCAVTLSIFLLQGFHLWGFQLDRALMHWIGGATVGSIGGLAGTIVRAAFKTR